MYYFEIPLFSYFLFLKSTDEKQFKVLYDDGDKEPIWHSSRIPYGSLYATSCYFQIWTLKESVFIIICWSSWNTQITE